MPSNISTPNWGKVVSGKKPAELKVVKGGRPSVKKKREPDEETKQRLVFVPREDGTIVCVEADTLYAMRLLQPVVVTVPVSVAGYEKLEP